MNERLPPPTPGVPMVGRMVTKGIEHNDKTIVWAIASPHPFATDVKVVRMFLNEGLGVWIYSTIVDGSGGMIDFMPIDRVIIVGKGTSIEGFIDALSDAENGAHEDPDWNEDPDEDEPEQQTNTTPTVHPNGSQPTS